MKKMMAAMEVALTQQQLVSYQACGALLYHWGERNHDCVYYCYLEQNVITFLSGT